MECAPTVRALVMKLAMPPLRVPVPRIVVPFLKVTDPTGTAPVGVVTLALNVTLAPNFEGFSEDVTDVALVVLFTTCDTVPSVPAVGIVWKASVTDW